MPIASLTPLAPAAGDPVSLGDAAGVSIGSDPACLIRIDGPEDGPPLARLEHRDDAWWLLPGTGTLRCNGLPVTAEVRLRDRDQLEIAPGRAYEFATGEKRTRRMDSAADMIARPRKPRSKQIGRPRREVPFAAIGTVVIATLLVVAAATVIWYTLFRATRTIVTLNDRQAGELDSLLAVAYDHVERGGTLLELGLGDGAVDEFARAVNTLELSDLRNNPQVRPRIEALQASVAAIYREQRLAVPGNYANATSPLTPDQLKTASLSVDQFAAQYALMAAQFKARFGHEIIVTGRDHAEHVALYGKGGAMDLSVADMTPVEIQFLVDNAHARHIRIKDFSQDTVLRRQVASAIKAGLQFEAGTGLHLHIDRFANRRDRWTTLRAAPSADPARQFAERRSAPGVVVSGARDGV